MWRQRGGRLLTIGFLIVASESRFAVDYNYQTNEWSLIIRDVLSTDEGTYQCEINPRTEDDDNSFAVTLIVE
jgi:hypothetical protein